MDTKTIGMESDQIKQAYKTAAQIVNLFGDVYLPIFQRLHEEIEKQESLKLLKSLAYQVAIE